MPQDLLQFLAPDQADDVVADRRANDLCLDRRRGLQALVDERAANGGKGIAVIESERPQPVAFVAEFKCFLQGERCLDRFFPQSPGWLEAFVVIERLELLRLAQ